MGQTRRSNKQTIKNHYSLIKKKKKNHYSLIGQLNIDFYRKLIAIQTFSGVTATEFDINKKKKKISNRSSPLCSNDLYALRSPSNICQMIRRNGDHKATKLFIGLRHPFTARIQ